MIDIQASEYKRAIIYEINGAFYLESVRFAEELWNEQLERKPDVIGIHCKNITFIDYSAIGLLIKFYNSACQKNIKLIFFDLSNRMISALKTARLDGLFIIMTKEEFEKKYLSHIAS